MSSNQGNDECAALDKFAATKQLVRDFLAKSIPDLQAMIEDQPADWTTAFEWHRGTDGAFRRIKRRRRSLSWIFAEGWLESRPRYEELITQMNQDSLLGPHLNRLVGTRLGGSRLDGQDILRFVIHSMITDDGTLSFDDATYDSKWSEIETLCQSDEFTFKTIAPLPHLAISSYPVRLNEQLVLDSFDEHEVRRCADVQVLRSVSSPFEFGFIDKESAVGVRRTIQLPKRVGDHVAEIESGEGVFGNRPLLRVDLVIEDVLSAMRLFKPTKIRAAGHASWTDSRWAGSGIGYQVLGEWPYGGEFTLSDSEIREFAGLWQLLEQSASRFTFSLHRFNLAFERGLIVDRVVDLVISAESLLLSDITNPYRGELRYRFALRAAKFMPHSDYSQREVFRIMRAAYDARSAIVHGGNPKPTDLKLPRRGVVDLPVFTDEVEQLVRAGLRKGLADPENAKNLGNSDYWDELVFEDRDQTSNTDG